MRDPALSAILSNDFLSERFIMEILFSGMSHGFFYYGIQYGGFFYENMILISV
jgi:hypothetical protein